MPTLLCCLEAWADCPEVTTAALKFMAEFVLNKTQRLTFDASSPNGILLFREVSKASALCLMPWPAVHWALWFIAWLNWERACKRKHGCNAALRPV